MRIDVIDDARWADEIMALAFYAKRMLVQECCAFGAPALRAVECACHWIASPCIVLVALTLVAPSDGTVDWWTYGHGADLDDENDGAGNENACDGLSPSQARYSRKHIQNIPQISRFCLAAVCPADILRTTTIDAVSTQMEILPSFQAKSKADV